MSVEIQRVLTVFVRVGARGRGGAGKGMGFFLKSRFLKIFFTSFAAVSLGRKCSPFYIILRGTSAALWVPAYVADNFLNRPKILWTRK